MCSTVFIDFWKILVHVVLEITNSILKCKSPYFEFRTLNKMKGKTEGILIHIYTIISVFIQLEIAPPHLLVIIGTKTRKHTKQISNFTRYSNSRMIAVKIFGLFHFKNYQSISLRTIYPYPKIYFMYRSTLNSFSERVRTVFWN